MNSATRKELDSPGDCARRTEGRKLSTECKKYIMNTKSVDTD